MELQEEVTFTLDEVLSLTDPLIKALQYSTDLNKVYMKKELKEEFSDILDSRVP